MKLTYNETIYIFSLLNLKFIHVSYSATDLSQYDLPPLANYLAVKR